MAKLNKSERAQQLNTIAQEVGAKYGYEDVKADFVAHADFKVTWERSYKVAEFHISDYLDGASANVLENLMDVIFSKIVGQESVEYNDEFKAYVNSKTFMKHRPTYIKRHRDLNGKEAYEQDGYLIIPTSRISSYTSALFKVIAVCEDDDIDEIFDEKVAQIKEGRKQFE